MMKYLKKASLCAVAVLLSISCSMPVFAEASAPEEEVSLEEVLKEADKEAKQPVAGGTYKDIPTRGEVAPTDYIPVLMYHHFVEDGEVEAGNGAIATINEFEEHLQTLLDAGYTFISLEELNGLLAGSYDKDVRELPLGLDKKYICITVDDGYKSNYNLMYPVLQKYGVKTDISVITSRIHSSEIVSPEIIKLTWGELNEMQESGLVSIYSHTNDHIKAGEVLYPTFRRSVEKAEKELDNKLKKRSPLKVLTYPNGNYTQQSMIGLRTMGYDLQLTTDFGVVNGKTSVAKIPRITINSGMAGADVLEKIEKAAQRSFFP